MRAKIFRVSRELLAKLLTHGTTYPAQGECCVHVAAGIPAGAKLLGIDHAGDGGWIDLMYSHPSFDKLPPLATIPRVEVRVEFLSAAEYESFGRVPDDGSSSLDPARDEHAQEIPPLPRQRKKR